VRVVITQRVHAEVVDMLAEHADVVMNESAELAWTREELIARARDAEALMVFMPDSIDDDFLAACPRLKIVSAALKGFDNFDVEACTRRGIWFTIVPDLLTEPTAELALALMLGLARNVPAGDALIRGGAFQGWRPTLYGTGLHGSTVGIIGFGKVGRALARMLQGFDCRVIHSDLGQDGITLDDLLATSDFILPLLPLTPATLHLIDAAALARMKPGAFLINVSRGSVVDEEAVADALDRGHLAGYAADTFEMEDWARPGRPQSIAPRLLQMKAKTLFTPHLGSAVARVRLEIEVAAASNILAVLRGERPSGAVNRLAGFAD
jgi:phosphonate dehydrogenase